MNRIIRKKNDNYTIISNVILRDKRITLKSKGLMALVMSLPPNWDFTVRGLIAILREGRDAIYASIKELRQYGYCDVVVCRDDNGKLAGNDYVFYEEPQYVEDRKEQPHTDKPHTENPHTENPPQISKEEKKDKESINNDDCVDEYSFDKFWNLYDKKVGKDKAKKLYDCTTRKDREAIFEHIPLYKQSQPEKQYRKNPETYLRNHSWKDEVINRTSNETTTNNQQHHQEGGHPTDSELRSGSIRNIERIRAERYARQGEIWDG